MFWHSINSIPQHIFFCFAKNESWLAVVLPSEDQNLPISDVQILKSYLGRHPYQISHWRLWNTLLLYSCSSQVSASTHVYNPNDFLGLSLRQFSIGGYTISCANSIPNAFYLQARSRNFRFLIFRLGPDSHHYKAHREVRNAKAQFRYCGSGERYSSGPSGPSGHDRFLSRSRTTPTSHVPILRF